MARLALLAGVALLAAPVEALAAGLSRLAYSRALGAERCPAESFLHDTAAARQPGAVDPFDDDAPRTITLKLRRGGQGYVAEATMVEGEKLTGDKTLTHPDCAVLVEAMAAVFTTWFFTVRHDPPPKPAPVCPAAPPAPQCPEAPTPQELPPEEPTPAPPPPRKPARLVAEAGALAAFGASPGPASFGLAGAVGLRWERFSVSLGVEGHLPAAHDGSASVSLVVGTAAPCVHAAWFVGCGLLEAGRVYSDGPYRSDVSAWVRPRFVYGAAGLRAGGDVPLVADHLALRLAADLIVPFSPTTVTNDFGKSAWTMPHVGAALGARLVGSFGP